MRKLFGVNGARAVPIILLGVAIGMASPARAEADVVMQAMQDELQRSMKELRLEELPKPYFISYRVDDNLTTQASASFGSLLSSNQTHGRWLVVEVRVGSPALDNTNFFALPGGPSGVLRSFGGRTPLPLEDDYQELRRQIWLATDGAYKEALENLSGKQAALQTKTRSEELADFSTEEPATIEDDAPVLEIDLESVSVLIAELSALFREAPEIFTSSVRFNATTTRTRFLNSEGSSFHRVAPLVRLTAVASTQATDGLPLDDFFAGYGRSMGDLPSREAMTAGIRDMIRRLSALREAPTVDRYNGPVLFEEQAAAELFAQAFAAGLLAQRAPVMGDPRMAAFAGRQGSSMEDRIGGRVLPRSFRVVDDPTQTTADEQPLVGGYKVDDQGVSARATTLVERGMLKTILSGRTPVSGVEHSSGNQRGGRVLPSNVVVSASGGLARAELKEELLALVADREGEFGVIVKRIGNPQYQSMQDRMSSVVMMFGGPGSDETKVAAPIEAYKVYPDGREELVRNLEISGLAPGSFKEIVASSDTRAIYTAPFPAGGDGPGMTFILGFGGGAGAGPPVVSWVIPSLLFEEITLKKPGGEVPMAPVAPHPYFEPAEQD